MNPAAPARSRPLRLLRFGANLARWGVPRRSLLFGPLSLGDDLLCTAVLREARLRGRPFAMMTARPELFAGNTDPARLLPIDDDFVAGLRRLGARIVQPYYVRPDPARPAHDLLPPHHIIAEMCRLAGLTGEIAVRPYLALTDAERAAAPRLRRQLCLHSSGLAAAIPYTTKEWGSERFAALVPLLAGEFSLVQLGSPRDPLLPGVSLDLRGRTTLREAAATLANSEVFIGLEGFLAHLARAVDCPAVVIHGGRADPHVFGYNANLNLHHRPACSPCGLRSECPHQLGCMEAITAARVAAAVRELTARPRHPLPVERVTL